MSDGNGNGNGGAPVYHELQEDPCWLIEVETSEDQRLIWHKNGRPNYLSKQLAETWIAHFKPHLFSILPDGSFVPQGSHADGRGIKRVRMVKDEAAAQ